MTAEVRTVWGEGYRVGLFRAKPPGGRVIDLTCGARGDPAVGAQAYGERAGIQD